jgi:hypothetical protein
VLSDARTSEDRGERMQLRSKTLLEETEGRSPPAHVALSLALCVCNLWSLAVHSATLFFILCTWQSLYVTQWLRDLYRRELLFKAFIKSNKASLFLLLILFSSAVASSTF